MNFADFSLNGQRDVVERLQSEGQPWDAVKLQDAMIDLLAARLQAERVAGDCWRELDQKQIRSLQKENQSLTEQAEDLEKQIEELEAENRLLRKALLSETAELEKQIEELEAENRLLRKALLSETAELEEQAEDAALSYYSQAAQ